MPGRHRALALKPAGHRTAVSRPGRSHHRLLNAQEPKERAARSPGAACPVCLAPSLTPPGSLSASALSVTLWLGTDTGDPPDVSWAAPTELGVLLNHANRPSVYPPSAPQTATPSGKQIAARTTAQPRLAPYLPRQTQPGTTGFAPRPSGPEPEGREGGPSFRRCSQDSGGLLPHKERQREPAGPGGSFLPGMLPVPRSS